MSLRLALLSTLALAACHHEKKEAEKLPVSVTNPARQDVEIVRRYVAQIRAYQHIEVRALERGYLQGSFVDEGKAVKKGERMFQILPLLYQAELQKAAAEAEFANIEYQNTKTLADKKVVSANELALIQAKLDKAKAELSLAKVHRDFTEVKAPFDGIMGRLSVRLGSLVDEGELLTTLSDNSQMWVYFNVAEAEYLDYRQTVDEGHEVAVKLQMANGKTFDQTGKIQTIEADFNNETGTIAFRATFPNPTALLRHGETGTVLLTNTLKDALVIPQKSTFEILDKRYVFVVDHDDTLRARQITVSEELPHIFVVSSGLTYADRLLLEGTNRVRDGDVVNPHFVAANEALARLEVPAQ